MKRKTALTVREITLIPCFSALIAACSLITVPMPGVPFTMQIFGVFFALACLGGRNGTIAVALYLALGAIGLPIFSAFPARPRRVIPAMETRLALPPLTCVRYTIPAMSQNALR